VTIDFSVGIFDVLKLDFADHTFDVACSDFAAGSSLLPSTWRRVENWKNVLK